MSFSQFRSSGLGAGGLCVCILTLQCGLCCFSASGQVGFDQDSTVPRQSYDLAETTLARGNYQESLKIAVKDYQGAMRFGGQRWIDSIASASLVGECHYELGNLQEAFIAYEDAMRLAVMSGDWLMSVQFPNQRLQRQRKAAVATWGRSSRNAMPASFPEVVTVRIGTDIEQVLKEGGVLAAPVNYPIRPQIIMRALTIAIYRHASILGDLAKERIVLENLIRSLEKRVAPPNHYSQSWVNVALGMAIWAQGRSDEAFNKLKAGLFAENQFDHELTAWALLGMGRIAIELGNDAEAAKLFEEATYTAADFGDARALEEAFHWVNIAYLAAGSQGIPTTLTGAAAWSKGKLPILHCRLQAAQAEHLVLAGDSLLAAKVLSGVDAKILQGDPGQGVCGAEVLYASSLVAYSSGKIIAGDRDLQRAIKIITPRSHRLFQTLKLVEWVQSSLVSDREANDMFKILLEDPDPRCFTLDPVGTLASIRTPRQLAYETWIAVAVNRSLEEGQAAAEVAARARWLQSQPLGGRQNAVEKLLHSRPDALSELDADRRSSMLARYPQLAAALNQMKQSGDVLRRLLKKEQSSEPLDQSQLIEEWKRYEEAALRQKQSVVQLAAGREPTSFLFPPLFNPEQIRSRLAEGEVLLSFHWTTTGLTGVLESCNGKAAWDIQQPELITNEIRSLLQSFGLFNTTVDVPTERLVKNDWMVIARRIKDLLFKNARINLADEAVKQLIIIPDGALWYLPFEILPIGTHQAKEGIQDIILRDTCQICYCPTRSLAVEEAGKFGGYDLVGLHLGRMHKADVRESQESLSERLKVSLRRPVRIGNLMENNLLMESGLLDLFLVFDELPQKTQINLSPMVVDWQRNNRVTFGQWVSLPGKRVQALLLPGFTSAASNSLVPVTKRLGDDLFQATTSLLAGGAHTVLISRWPMGGQSTIRLMEEFVIDLQNQKNMSSVTESWHRAVDVVSFEEPDINREPRLSQSTEAVLSDSRHPVFWSGHLLMHAGKGHHKPRQKEIGNVPKQPLIAAPVMQVAP